MTFTLPIDLDHFFGIALRDSGSRRRADDNADRSGPQNEFVTREEPLFCCFHNKMVGRKIRCIGRQGKAPDESLSASKACIIFVRMSEDLAMPKTLVPLSPRGRGARGEGASR
jgi:hypothetical protein